MDAVKAEVISQIRELNVLLIQSKLHVGRSKLAQHFRGNEETADFRSMHGQGRLLSILGLHPEGSQTNARDLSFMLGMSKQLVIDLLARLEQKGLIVRKQPVDGSSAPIITLTEKGREAAEHVRNPEVGGSEILDCLNEEELAQFSRYLERIIENAEAKCSNDEFAERRKAMQEFFSVVHFGSEDDELHIHEPNHGVGRSVSRGGQQ